MSSKNKKPQIPLRNKSIDKPSEDITKIEENEEHNIFEELGTDINSEDDIFGNTKEIEDDNITDIEDDIIYETEEIEEEDGGNEININPTIIETAGPEKEKQEELVLEIDPNRTYFFVFGAAKAGKSTMVQSLAWYLKAFANGQIESISSADKQNHRQGDYVLSEMIKNVKKGEYASDTRKLKDEVLSTEINLLFKPENQKKPDFPFCILEMAGEDLQAIELQDFGKTGGILDKRINAYLKHPDCSMVFICTIDVEFPDKSEDFIDAFLDYARKLGHETNPILVTINKWDIVASQYTDGEHFLKEKTPIIYKKLHDPNRYFSYMPFSIGEGIDNIHFKNHNKEDAKKLFEWMYEVSMGESIHVIKSPSILDNLFASLKSLFRK